MLAPRNVESIKLRGPIVAMVQPAKPWVRDDPTGSRGGSSASRCLLRKAEMRAVFMVVADGFGEQPFQMLFIERDNMIQQVTTAASNPALGDPIGMSVQLRRMAMLKVDVSE